MGITNVAGNAREEADATDIPPLPPATAIIGTPGVGKSVLLLAAIYYLAPLVKKTGGKIIVHAEKKKESSSTTVVMMFELDPRSEQGRVVHLKPDLLESSPLLWDDKNWYLVDGKTPLSNNCNVILVREPGHLCVCMSNYVSLCRQHHHGVR